MVAVVDGLEGAGYVERRRDPRDRRAYSLQATARGRRVLQQAAEATRRAEEEFLAPLPDADRRRLKRILRDLLEP
jgi:DNA-binding MarR family transcriptional regulator